MHQFYILYPKSQELPGKNYTLTSVTLYITRNMSIELRCTKEFQNGAWFQTIFQATAESPDPSKHTGVCVHSDILHTKLPRDELSLKHCHLQRIIVTGMSGTQTALWEGGRDDLPAATPTTQAMPPAGQISLPELSTWHADETPHNRQAMIWVRTLPRHILSDRASRMQTNTLPDD